MNTTRRKRSWRTLRAFGLFLAVPAAMIGADQSSQTRKTSSSETRAAGQHLALARADDVIGRDVMAGDGKKAGDIVDLVFDLQGRPEVTHVLVMTGGFLNMGGDVRAVPVSAISVDGETYHLDLGRDAFFRVPLVSADRTKFFSDATLVGSVEKHFGNADSRKDHASRENHDDSAAQPSSKAGALENPVFYSSINGREVRGSAGGNLGTVTDAWVNLTESRAPLIEIRPGVAIGTPFTATNQQDRRYQLPAAKFERAEGNQLHFDISASEIENAPSVTDIEWANMRGERFDRVIRLDMSEVRQRQNREGEDRQGS